MNPLQTHDLGGFLGADTTLRNFNPLGRDRRMHNWHASNLPAHSTMTVECHIWTLAQ